MLISCFTFISFAAPTLVSAASLQLGWIDNSKDEDGFHVERKIGAGGIFSLIATTGPGATSYSDDNLADGTTYCYRVTAFNSAGKSTYTNEACAATSTSAVQPSDPSAGATVLSNSNSSTATQSTLTANTATHIGVFRPDTGEWFLDGNGNGQWDGCTVDACAHSFGQAGDLPVTRKVGNANATLIGIFRQGKWMFDSNGNGAFDNCSVDECDSFGLPDDLPVTDDWNGSRTEGIGVFRPSTGGWFLDMNGNGQFDGCDVDKCLGPFGADGDLPVVGDWNGMGEVRIGVYRPGTGEWLLDTNGNGRWDGCDVDTCLGYFGMDGDLPIVGDWNGTGKASIGVYRPGTGDWFLDMNGNGNFDGCAVDACLGPFGQAGDSPVVGDW